jgi:hypothetical protein
MHRAEQQASEVQTDTMVKICCIGAGYVGGPSMAVMALKCPAIDGGRAFDLCGSLKKRWKG